MNHNEELRSYWYQRGPCKATEYFPCIHVLAPTKMQILEIPLKLVGCHTHEMNNKNTYEDGNFFITGIQTKKLLVACKKP